MEKSSTPFSRPETAPSNSLPCPAWCDDHSPKEPSLHRSAARVVHDASGRRVELRLFRGGDDGEDRLCFDGAFFTIGGAGDLSDQITRLTTMSRMPDMARLLDQGDIQGAAAAFLDELRVAGAS